MVFDNSPPVNDVVIILKKTFATNVNEEKNNGTITSNPLNELSDNDLFELFENQYGNFNFVSGVLDDIFGCFGSLYNENPIVVHVMLQTFLQSLRSVPNLMLSLLGFPFYELEHLSDEEFKTVQGDFSKVFIRHLEVAYSNKSKKENTD